MRSAGALFASIGTGVMLVAAVTVSLLSVSAVFALGGFEGADDAKAGEALVLDLQGRSGSGSASAGRTVKAPAVAVVRRQPPPPSRRTVARRPSRRPDTVRANAASVTTAAAGASQVASLDEEAIKSRPPVAQQAAPPTVPKKPAPNLGDGVKKLGDGLSAGVQQTGTKLAKITAPLGPTVSTSVQQVLNVVAAVVKGTTDRLGALLGARP